MLIEFDMKNGFADTIKRMNYEYKGYVEYLENMSPKKRIIDFSKEPDQESFFKYMAIPNFQLFPNFFTNRDLDRDVYPIKINEFHQEASVIIPKTYNEMWQAARRSNDHIYLIGGGSSSINNPDFFINFYKASQELQPNSENRFLDETLLSLFQSFVAFSYSPIKTTYPTVSRWENPPHVPLEKEPVFEITNEYEKNGVLWYSFFREQGKIELTTPWKLDSEEPSLLKITDILSQTPSYHN